MENKNNSNLQELNLKEKIIGWRCSECDQAITEENYKDKNYTLWFSADDYQWEEIKDTNPINPPRRIKLTLEIGAITHEKTSFYDCPDTELCAGCDKKFKEVKVKRGLYEEQGEESFYCEPCFDAKFGEYLKARAKRKNLTQEQKDTLKIIQKALNEHLNSNYHKGQVDYYKCKGSECKGYQLTLESYGYERQE